MVVFVSGKFPYTVSEILQEALSMAQQWCERTQLSINLQNIVTVPFTRKRDLRGIKEPTLSRHKLHVATEVKYLGVTLDKKLTWKTQLGNVIKKVYRAFWTRKDTFGKTWRLKLKVLHCIYIMIIRPVLTYGSTVCWTRANYNVSKMELNKLQRIACLATTGAMKTTPTTAIELLLGHTPLHVTMEAEAQPGIYRLMSNQQWRPRFTNYGHAKKSRDMEQEPILPMGTDRMTPRCVFHKPFKVLLANKHEWDNGFNPNKGGLVWYTDGSKTNEGTGAGMY
jgi:hypothetical protein